VEAWGTEIVIKENPEKTFEKAPYFTEHVRKYLEQKYGRDSLYKGGLKVYTTLNLDMQRKAQAAVRKGLLELDKREGYRGPLKHLPPNQREAFKEGLAEKEALFSSGVGDVVQGVIEKVDEIGNEAVVSLGTKLGILPISEMRWARKPNSEVSSTGSSVKNVRDVLRAGDVVLVQIKEEAPKPYDWKVSLEQEPEVQGALFCMETASGKVKAMVGGHHFSESQFNRAVQARRQPGSHPNRLSGAALIE
jgi:penicillin-binding protein 1A